MDNEVDSQDVRVDGGSYTLTSRRPAFPVHPAAYSLAAYRQDYLYDSANIFVRPPFGLCVACKCLI